MHVRLKRNVERRREDMDDPPPFSPLPVAGITQVLGLLEILDDRGGGADIHRLARDLHHEPGEFLDVVRASEILGLTETPKNHVVLTEAGRNVLEASISERRRILKERILALPLVQYFVGYLEHKGEHCAEKEDVLEVLATLFPDHNPEEQFQVLVGWGRYGEIFCYDIDTEEFSLDEGDPPSEMQPA
jgi:NitT/TauT family transport system ATP-binding protein